jgi:23S rRNA (uracil1939-C5)-methyltransferase
VSRRSGGGARAPRGGSRARRGPPAGKSIIELEIDSIAAGGDGVGRDESGRVVFVPLTAPGDRVRAEIVRAKARWARGRLQTLLVAAPERRAAPCPVFGQCGGCRLQHLPEAVQAGGKREVVVAALARIGGLDIEVPPLVSAGEPFGYRNRVTLTVRSGGVVAGFHSLYAPAEIVDAPNCLLAEAPIQAAWEALAPWHELPRGPQGVEVRVTIRASATGTLALLVEGGSRPGEPEAVARRLPTLASFLWIDEAGERQLLAGEPTFADEWQGTRFELDPTVFLQVNRAVSGAMDAWIDERLARLAAGDAGEARRPRVADLYAGVAARAIRWAGEGFDVATCEVVPEAADATRRAIADTGITLDVREGTVEAHSDLFERDLVVVNPPRAGLSPEVRAALVEGSARAVAYVSGDPATLARDLEAVSAAYRLEAVQPFDAFPQTAHVETVAWLVRRDGAGEAR